jgi:hypothetical protein
MKIRALKHVLIPSAGKLAELRIQKVRGDILNLPPRGDSLPLPIVGR